MFIDIIGTNIMFCIIYDHYLLTTLVTNVEFCLKLFIVYEN